MSEPTEQQARRQEDREPSSKADIIGNTFAAIIAHYKRAPAWAMTTLALAAGYVVICLFAQVKPQEPPRAVLNAFSAWVQTYAAAQSEVRQFEVRRWEAEAKERQDIVALLLEQNRELREARVESDPPEPGYYVLRLERRVERLERDMQVLRDSHPNTFARAQQ